jgi:hypothetical protein
MSKIVQDTQVDICSRIFLFSRLGQETTSPLPKLLEILETIFIASPPKERASCRAHEGRDTKVDDGFGFLSSWAI